MTLFCTTFTHHVIFFFTIFLSFFLSFQLQYCVSAFENERAIEKKRAQIVLGDKCIQDDISVSSATELYHRLATLHKCIQCNRSIFRET